eukprot:830290_1
MYDESETLNSVVLTTTESDNSALVSADDPYDSFLYIVATLFGLCLCLCGVGLVIRKVENTSNAQVHGHVFDVKSMSSAVSNECEIHYFPDPAPNVQMVDEKESIINCDVDTTDIKVWLTDTVTLPMYFDSFIANGFNTLENVKGITTESQLTELGIHKVGHQKRILD